MASRIELLAQRVDAHFADRVTRIVSTCDELTYEVDGADLLSVAATLRDGADFKFEQLIDLTGVDYLHYGQVEWFTQESTNSGFSRGVARGDELESEPAAGRFAVVYHL